MTSDQHHGSAGGDELGLGELKEQASQKVSQVADSLKQEAARREDSIRDNLSKQADSLASALRSAKSEIDPQSGIGKMFDYAADSVGSMAHSLKSADTAEMVDSVRSFARERPGAFLGLCALGGFGAARFLIAGVPSAGRSTGTGTGTGMTGSHGRTGSQTGLADRSGASLASQQQGGQASIHGSGHGSGTSGGTSGSHMGSAGSASPTGSGMSGGSGSGMSGSGTTGSGTTGSGTSGSGTAGSATGSGTGSGVGGDLGGSIGGGSTGTGSSSGAEKARVPGYGNAPGTSGTGGGQ